MLIIFTFISTLIISAHAKRCAIASDDDTLYIYPSINNCSTFIVCYHNEEIEMNCLESSLFMYTDERVCLESCATKRRIGSRKKFRGSKITYDFSSDYLLFPLIDAPSPTILCPSYGTTKAAIPQNCDEYIECNDGIGMRRKCENGYKFSPTQYECLDVNLSDCVINKKLKGLYNSKCHRQTGISNLSSFVFPSEKCSNFRKCANFLAWTIRCAKNTSFSKKIGSCEWNDEVEC